MSELVEVPPFPGILDKTNPRSLISLVWTDFSEVMERTYLLIPELFSKTERELVKRVKPDVTTRMLRIRFWQEYDMAQGGDRKMMQGNIMNGLCFPEYWSRELCRQPELVVYVITPPPKYFHKMEAMLEIALDEILQILEMPLFDGKGKLKESLLKHKIKLFELLDLRVKGAVMQKVAIHQRIDQKITQGPTDPLMKMELPDLRALDQSIQKIRGQIDRVEKHSGFLMGTVEEEVKLESEPDTDPRS